MRDGLYKVPNAPLRWNKLLRSVGREAERGTSTPQRLAQQAMRGDVRHEITQAFLKNFKQRALQTEAHLPGFGPLSTCEESRELGGQNSPLENDCLAAAKRAERAGFRGIKLAERALAAALRSRGECRILEIQQQTLDQNARDAVQGFAEAVRCLDFEKIASSLLNDVSSSEIKRIREPLDVDEDLRMPR